MVEGAIAEAAEKINNNYIPITCIFEFWDLGGEDYKE